MNVFFFAQKYFVIDAAHLKAILKVQMKLFSKDRKGKRKSPLVFNQKNLDDRDSVRRSIVTESLLWAKDEE